MEKKTFVDAINNIEKQTEKNIEFSENLSKAFPNAFKANLLPDNEIIVEGLIELLQKEMDDQGDWINYYLWELNFGKENYRSQIKDKDGKIIPLSNAEELYDILANNIYLS